MSKRLSPKIYKVLKEGRMLFNTDNDGLTRIAGAFYASLETDAPAAVVEGAGIAKTVMNATRRVMKRRYGIPNLRDLTDKDGLTQLPYSNFIGPGTDLDSALKAGPVTAGPAGEDKNANGMSADEIAKQHDLLYENAANLSPEEKFKAIQYADKWMIDEVETLPDSRTKSLILKSLKVKYAAEKARGKVIYGGKEYSKGKLKFKPLRGGQWVQTNSKDFAEKSIDAIINGKVRTGKLTTRIKTRADKIAENLKIKKDSEDEEKAKEIEKTKPFGEADKSILNSDAKMSKQFHKVDYKNKDTVYRYAVFFKKNHDITERPPIEWKEIKEITDYSTGDKYVYNFCVHVLDEDTYGVDNVDNVDSVDSVDDSSKCSKMQWDWNVGLTNEIVAELV